MYYLDHTLPTLLENLALDEALLLAGEETPRAILRVWEWPAPAVVLGAAGRLAAEVQEAACLEDGVQLARRASGGGTVLLGPGCLLFSLILPYDRAPELAEIISSYCFILGRLVDALAPLAPGISCAGTSDLARNGRKVSGNSQQRKRRHLLHHGTLLYGFDLDRVGRYLPIPERQPAYRSHRPHGDFLANLPATKEALKCCLCQCWQAQETLPDLPMQGVRELVEQKYSRDDWLRRR